MNYGEKLKELREYSNLTQKQIANILNIDNTTYGHYEKQDCIIPLKHLNELCNYFKVSFDYIFEFSNLKAENTIKVIIDKKIAGERLKNFRKENKITQDMLATLLNTNRSVIANYERGRTIIATPFLYTICKKYKISADYLLGKTNSPKSFN